MCSWATGCGISTASSSSETSVAGMRAFDESGGMVLCQSGKAHLNRTSYGKSAVIRNEARHPNVTFLMGERLFACRRGFRVNTSMSPHPFNPHSVCSLSTAHCDRNSQPVEIGRLGSAPDMGKAGKMRACRLWTHPHGIFVVTPVRKGLPGLASIW
jgi:hypothetical protein